MNLPYVTWNVQDKEFRLRLTTMGVVKLEDKLGRNPADIFLQLSDGQLPKIGDVLTILHQSLQSLHSGYTLEKAAGLLDSYFEEGHSVYEFLTDTVMKVFQSAGLLGTEMESEEGEEKDNPNA
jgi:hypothetical protein